MLNLERSNRIFNKIKREILLIKSVQDLDKILRQQKIDQHRDSLPPLSPQDSLIVEFLEKEGVFISSLEALSIPSTSRFLNSAQKLLVEITEDSDFKNPVKNLPISKLMKYPEMVLWGLEERLLNIIENYLGLSLLYHEPLFKREIANGEKIDVRQWHFDIEDRSMIKIIIYFNDVDLEGGPFEYISKPLSLSIPRRYKISGGFIMDENLNKFVPESAITSCLGKAGTVIIADTSNVLHRIKPPLTADRFSLTFTYTSVHPVKIYKKKFFSRSDLAVISSRLSERQRKCLIKN